MIVIVCLLEFYWSTIRPITLPSTEHQDISNQGICEIQHFFFNEQINERPRGNWNQLTE